MPIINNLKNLTINKVENQEVYDYMANNDLIKDDELYFVTDEAVSEDCETYSKLEVNSLLSHNMSNKTVQSIDVVNTRIDNLFLETTEEEITSLFTE